MWHARNALAALKDISRARCRAWRNSAVWIFGTININGSPNFFDDETPDLVLSPYATPFPIQHRCFLNAAVVIHATPSNAPPATHHHCRACRAIHTPSDFSCQVPIISTATGHFVL